MPKKSHQARENANNTSTLAKNRSRRRKIKGFLLTFDVMVKPETRK